MLRPPWCSAAERAARPQATGDADPQRLGAGEHGDIVPADPANLAPCQDRDANQFGVIVADAEQGATAAAGNDRVQLAYDWCADSEVSATNTGTRA